MNPTVVALGGNALQPGQHALDFPQLTLACKAMADIADGGLLVTHGNGPQIGLLGNALRHDLQQSLDVLGAETEGWLGYAIEQELGNHLCEDSTLATVLTRVEVARDDPGLLHPEKPIGPWLQRRQADKLRHRYGWQFIERDDQFRRLVASPRPIQVLQLKPIELLLQQQVSVICAGGGGIPVTKSASGKFVGVEAVVDKDFSSALIATLLNAKLLIFATNVDGVYRNWGGECQEKLCAAQPQQLLAMDLPAGSMKPKVAAACEFVIKTGNVAVIGAINELDKLLAGKAGTVISNNPS